MKTVEISDNAYDLLYDLLKLSDADECLPTLSEGDTIEQALYLLKNMDGYPYLQDIPVAWALFCKSIAEARLAKERRES